MDVSAVITSCTLSEARFLLDHFMSMAINKVPNRIIQRHYGGRQHSPYFWQVIQPCLAWRTKLSLLFGWSIMEFYKLMNTV